MIGHFDIPSSTSTSDDGEDQRSGSIFHDAARVTQLLS